MSGSIFISKARLGIKLWLKTALAIPGVLLRSHPPYTRVLFYHRVNPFPIAELGPVSRELTVQPEMFEAQLQHLKNGGFRTLRLEEFQRMMEGVQAVDTKAILITFDDGYEDNLLWAAPLLHRYGFSAVVFIVSDFIGKSTSEVWPNSDPAALGRFLDIEQIAQWQNNGLEIGSHSKTHPLLSSLPTDLQWQELSASRETLLAKFGGPIQSIAYPGGDFDDETAKHARGTGYSLAFTTIPGVNRPGSSLMAVRRTEVSASDNMLVFRAKMAGLLDWLAFKESLWFRQWIGRINRLLIPFAQASRADK